MRRERREAEPGEYSDPLKNYDPPEYADDLERALCDETLAAIKTKPFETIPPDMTVFDALKRFMELDIACLMVAEDDRLVGILTERDILDKVAEQFEQHKLRPVRDFMTEKPVAAYITDSPAKALNVMAFGGFRHIPILDVDDKIVGILGPRRITAYIQQHVV